MTTLNFKRPLAPSTAVNFRSPDYTGESRVVAPPPCAEGGFGAHGVRNRTEALAPSSIPTLSRFGQATLALSLRVVQPEGFSAQAVGWPTLFNRQQFITGPSIHRPYAFGDAIKVRNAREYLRDAGGKELSLFGGTRVAGSIRNIYPSGVSSAPIGVAWVSFSPRWLEPKGIAWNHTGLPTFGFEQLVSAEGFDASAFGTRIVPPYTEIGTEAIDATSWGDAWVSNYRRQLIAQGFRGYAPEEFRFGHAAVWNWQTFVPVESELKGEVFGIWTRVENQRRVVQHHSVAPGFLPSPYITNAARSISPTGIGAVEAGLFEKQGEVSHRRRQIHPEALPPPAPSRWLNLANSARLLRTQGVPADIYGVGSVWNTRRYLLKIGDFDASAIGAPLVADGVRTISFEERYGIAPPSIPVPDVRLHTRYIEQGGGFESYRTGGAHLEVHRNIVAPRWAYRDDWYWGVPTVRNVTPMLGQRGRCTEEFGDTQVRTQWRTLIPNELYSQAFGKAKIGDRKQWIEPFVIGAPPISDKLTVWNLKPDPPAARTIVIPSNESIGYEAAPREDRVTKKMRWKGQPVDDHGMGTPTCGAASIYPEAIDPDAQMLFGKPLVSLMGVMNAQVSMLLPPLGTPTVRLSRQVVKVENKSPGPNDPPSNMGPLPVPNPRLSPLTVWAVVEAPEQAVANHPISGTLHYVDLVVGAAGESSWWKKGVGKPQVALSIRRLHPQGFQIGYDGPDGRKDDFGFGNAALCNRNVYVEVLPIKPAPFGKPKLLAYSRLVKVSNNNTPQHKEHLFGPMFGDLFVSNWARSLAPEPIASSVDFGDETVVDYYHRFVRPYGVDTSHVSSYSGHQNPYQWQHIRVGELWPTVPQGDDMALFGNTWVSNKVRGIEPVGVEPVLMGDTFDDFNLRMRVKYWPEPSRPFRPLAPFPIDAAVIPMPYVGHTVQYILPDGNMDNFRKGAPDA